jgi:molecular chaperone GrpE
MNTQEALNETEQVQDSQGDAVETTLDVNTDDSVAGTQHLNEPVADSSELEQVKAELAEQKDKYLRLFAEFDNFKRRTAKERLELIQTAGREIITALLDVLDDMDRAEKVMASGADSESVKEGVMLVFHKLRTTLEQKGLKAMNAVNEDFNADFHEAITEIPAPTEALKGKVIDEVQKGYLLGEKIIRYAKVVVGK